MASHLLKRALPIVGAVTTTTLAAFNASNSTSNERVAHCAQNIMLQSHRSRLSRELSDKYAPDWKEVLGEGAYGTVHIARLKENNKKVALKKISKKYTNSSSFNRETNSLLAIHDSGGHPNVAGLLDMYEDRKFFYMVLDLVSGGEMFEHLIRNGAYSEHSASRLFRQAASALYFLHGLGIIHADLKPENLMLSSWREGDENVKIVDFGCAILDTETATALTKDAGTTAYWPPEAFEKQGVSKEMDMWSMGVILFIMLTGHHPFDLNGTNTDAEIENIIRKNPHPPLNNSVASHLSPSAKDLIKKLMTKNKSKRMTASELLDHPWVKGLTARRSVMPNSDKKLSRFADQRDDVSSAIFAVMVNNSNSNNILTANSTAVASTGGRKRGWKDLDKRSGNGSARIIEQAFEVFDKKGKGYISGDDVGRVLGEVTGVEVDDARKNEYVEAMLEEDDDDAPRSKRVDLSNFSTLMSNLETQFYPRGHAVFKEGDKGDAMYFMNSGKAEVVTKDGTVISSLSGGDFFGEGCMLDPNKQRNASVVCKTPVECIEIPRGEFDKFTRNSSNARSSLRIVDNLRTLDKAKSLIRLQKNVKTHNIGEGGSVFKEGDDGQSMFTVSTGKFLVTVNDVHVGTLLSDDMFGETSLLMNRPRSATVTCVSKEGCNIYEMLGDDFRALLDNSGVEESLRDMSRRREFKKAMRQKAGGMVSLKEMFESADKDKSGTLNLSEVRQMLRSLDEDFPESEIVEMMKSMDLDNNGKVSLNEFERVMQLGTR